MNLRNKLYSRSPSLSDLASERIYIRVSEPLAIESFFLVSVDWMLESKLEFQVGLEKVQRLDNPLQKERIKTSIRQQISPLCVSPWCGEFGRRRNVGNEITRAKTSCARRRASVQSDSLFSHVGAVTPQSLALVLLPSTIFLGITFRLVFGHFLWHFESLSHIISCLLCSFLRMLSASA